MINYIYRRCKCCAYWDSIDLYAPEDDEGNVTGPTPEPKSGHAEGLCKRFPPKILAIPENSEQENAWQVSYYPATIFSDQCGEFRQAELLK